MSVEQQAGLLLVCMQVQQFQIVADAARLVLQRRRRRRTQRRRMLWVRPWLEEAGRRFQHGHYHRLMPELRLEDPCSYFNYLRVPPSLFDELLDRLRQQDLPYRKALEPGFKLAMTLRHLASGDRYASMKFDFRVPHNTAMSLCVREVCQAIIDEFKDECIQCPTTEEEWRAISAEFERRWNVPHACSALDGKHIACRCPRNSGSVYFNYKGVFSIVLMGLADAPMGLWDPDFDGGVLPREACDSGDSSRCFLDWFPLVVIVSVVVRHLSFSDFSLKPPLSFFPSYQSCCLLESKRTNERDFVSVLPTSRHSCARTPWKRGANAVEARCERQGRRANAVKTSCKLHGTPHRTPQNAVRTP